MNLKYTIVMGQMPLSLQNPFLSRRKPVSMAEIPGGLLRDDKRDAD
jgi:hypothetical protein